MPDAFDGFPADFFAFFTELAANNDRDWFTANKPRYQSAVVAPMNAFIEAMAPRLDAISGAFIAAPGANGGSMFRIHRDTRFSKDKRPYKEHAACQFRHEVGRDVHAPGFYVELSPERIVYGGGIWRAASPELLQIRELIRDDPDRWAAVREDERFLATFPEIEGESLKRAPRGFDPDLPFIEDLKRKSHYAVRTGSRRDAMSPGFLDDVEDAFQAAEPLMRFLCRAVGVAY